MSSAALEMPALLARYPDVFDAGDFSGAARLFYGGCVATEGREISGADNIAAMWASFVRNYEDRASRTRHLVTNLAITISDEGEHAQCRSQWTVFQQVPAETLKLVGTGRYDDWFCYDGGAWSLARRNYASVDFWGDASGHLKHFDTNKDQSNGNL